MRRASVALLAAAGLAIGGCAADDVDAPGEDVEVEEGVEGMEEGVEEGVDEMEEQVDEGAEE